MAVNATTVTTAAALVRRLYRDGQRIENIGNHQHPLKEKIKVEDDWKGDGNYSWTVETGRNQAVGASLSVVMSNIDNDKSHRFTFTTPVEMYGAAKIAGKALAMVSGKGLAVADFGRLVTRVNDNTIKTMKDRMAQQIYGSGSGSIGRRASISSDTITLHNIDDAKNFQEGQYIVFDDADGGGTVKAGQCMVENVDYDAGKITVDDITNITGPANDDYIFNAALDYDGVIKGLAAWFPFTAPAVGGSSFYGVDRSKDVIRLSGHRVDGSSATIKEAAEELAIKMSRLNGSKGERQGFLNPVQWNNLQKDLESKVERDPGGEGRFGFKFLVQSSALGDIQWYADPDCPTDRGYILDVDTLFTKSVGKLPHVYADDGQEAVRDLATPSDAIITWYRAWWALGCLDPSRNGVMQLAT